MSGSRKTQRMKKKRNFATMVCFLIVAVVVGVLVWPRVVGVIDSGTAEPTTTPTATAEPVETVKPNQFELEEDGLRINTQFISLLYPMDYANEVMIDVSEEAGQSIVNVLATFDGVDREMFSLILSTTEGEGYKMGVLKREDGDIGIYIRMNEMNVEDWPEEEAMRLNRLQESVNTLLDQMYQDEGFSNG